MKFTPLALLISGCLMSHSVIASNQELSLTDAGSKISNTLKEMQILAEQKASVVERNNKLYLQYQGKEYWLNHNNEPKFPLNNKKGDYSAAFPFIGSDWEYIAYNGGFYLLHQQNGILNADDTGCYVEYIPADRGSQRDDGSYIWERDTVLRTVMSDCGDLSIPVISDFKAQSTSDIGAEFNWSSNAKAPMSYTLELTSQVVGESSITQSYKDIKAPGFYVGSLTPSTHYEAILTTHNALGSDTQTFQFTTQPTRLSYNDNRRAENHLTGNFQANLAFAQTHTSVAPYGNDEKVYPNLIINREALLLVTPKIRNTNQIWVEVIKHGNVIKRIAMTPPSGLADTDQPDNGRNKVIFSHYAWSLPLQWQWIQPGLSLRFTDNHNRIGELPQSHITFGGAPELVIQNIDIGMLTPPRNQYSMIKDMPKLAADYFQKIPASKLVMADYTPLHLTKVTLPNGKVYTEQSDDEGGVYGGDMREAVGKALISTGINNANFGIVDSAGYSQAYNRRFNHITAHNNRGAYSNGIVTHGLSGGGGIVTLQSSVGNEWSHELGHNYARGHWPTNASSHDLNTGWGWDALYQRFIGNLHWTGDAWTNDVGGQLVPPFANEFRFTRDAMAGGESARIGKISSYTLEHPTGSRYTQNWFNQVNTINLDSSTGYTHWDQNQQRYIDSDVDYAAPIEKGVPVITVLGIYDPTGINASQIYPLTYSNYGNVYDLPAPTTTEPQLEGWQFALNITANQRLNTQWQTLKVNNVWLPLCQFSYTNTNGTTANFVGYEDNNAGICRVVEEMHWNVNGQREVPISEFKQYQLLSTKSDQLQAATYIPSLELGEMTLCSLNKSGTSHDGAGFISNGKCTQLPNVKHSNGNNWSYASHQGGIKQYSFSSQRQCQLTIENENGTIDNIALSSSRYSENQSNKFHLNLSANSHPNRLSVSCRSGNETEMVLDTSIPEPNSAINDLKGPVIIGQEFGYQATESTLPSGWFAHTVGFNPTNLTNQDRTQLATLRLGNEYSNVCRFLMDINGSLQTLHGYVESLGSGDFQCTGGTEITVRDTKGERPLLSQLNQFEWLSLNNKLNVGERVKATKDSDAKLCTLTKGGEWYGAGFVNSTNQCVQRPEVYWSNGRQWVFSSGYGKYSYQ